MIFLDIGNYKFETTGSISGIFILIDNSFVDSFLIVSFLVSVVAWISRCS